MRLEVEPGVEQDAPRPGRATGSGAPAGGRPAAERPPRPVAPARPSRRRARAGPRGSASRPPRGSKRSDGEARRRPGAASGATPVVVIPRRRRQSRGAPRRRGARRGSARPGGCARGSGRLTARSAGAPPLRAGAPTARARDQVVERALVGPERGDEVADAEHDEDSREASDAQHRRDAKRAAGSRRPRHHADAERHLAERLAVQPVEQDEVQRDADERGTSATRACTGREPPPPEDELARPRRAAARAPRSTDPVDQPGDRADPEPRGPRDHGGRPAGPRTAEAAATSPRRAPRDPPGTPPCARRTAGTTRR